MNRYFRWAMLLLVAISLALGQTEEERRRFLGQIHSALGLESGMIVADIGTGDSLEQTVEISKVVGDSGRVICVDIDDKALERLRARVSAKALRNVEVRLSKPDDPMLPANSMNAVLIAYAYHHFASGAAMLAHIRKALLPDGRLVVIEAISGKNRHLLRPLQVRDHELSPELLIDELKAAGFETPNFAETIVDDGSVRRYLVVARPAH